MCTKFAQNVRGVCTEFAENVYRICAECTQNVHRMYAECAQNMLKICTERGQFGLRDPKTVIFGHISGITNGFQHLRLVDIRVFSKILPPPLHFH